MGFSFKKLNFFGTAKVEDAPVKGPVDFLALFLRKDVAEKPVADDLVRAVMDVSANIADSIQTQTPPTDQRFNQTAAGVLTRLIDFCIAAHGNEQPRLNTAQAAHCVTALCANIKIDKHDLPETKKIAMDAYYKNMKWVTATSTVLQTVSGEEKEKLNDLLKTSFKNAHDAILAAGKDEDQFALWDHLVLANRNGLKI